MPLQTQWSDAYHGISTLHILLNGCIIKVFTFQGIPHFKVFLQLQTVMWDDHALDIGTHLFKLYLGFSDNNLSCSASYAATDKICVTSLTQSLLLSLHLILHSLNLWHAIVPQLSSPKGTFTKYTCVNSNAPRQNTLFRKTNHVIIVPSGSFICLINIIFLSTVRVNQKFINVKVIVQDARNVHMCFHIVTQISIYTEL